MKTRLFTLFALLIGVCSGVWAAAVTDLVTISENWTFIADDITANGTAKLTKNKLYCEGKIFAPTENSVATNKGNSTINGTTHLNSLRLKNTQDQLAFKVSGSCTVIFYTQSHPSRGIQVGSSEGGTQFGSQTASTTEWSCNITKGGTVYLSSSGGDFYFAGFKVVFPKPEITTQPVGGSYGVSDPIAALTVAATASKGDLAYQWYACDDANKTNAGEIDGATSSSYTPTGAGFFFCRVSDDNGSTDSKVVEVTISANTAPSISISSSDATIEKYEAATLTATVLGFPAPSIQWYSCDDADKTNATAIDGETSTTYTPSTATTGTYYFYAVATNIVSSSTSNVISLTVTESITGQTFYSWNQGTETGGTAVASDNESVGAPNSIYTTIRLNGKNDFSDKTVTITLDKALKTGDKIIVTAYRNKNDKNKQAGFKAKFEIGSSTVSSSTGLEYVNIDTSDASAEDSNRGTEPNTCTFVVPASAMGSKTITMTRSHTATNLFITKIEIYRPSISLNAVLNAAGLLTADEVANQDNFSFGVTSANERVAADAGNAVTVLTGKYHNEHGCTSLSVVAKVPGKVKISIGQCTYSKSEITIKNSSNVIVAALTPNTPSCWKNDHTKVHEFYYSGDATTLTITGMTYCPYVGIEEVDEVPVIEGTITASGYNTFSCCYPLDLSTISKGTAYIASAVNSGKVIMTKVNDKIVAAGTGLLIAGETGEKFTIGTSNNEATFSGTNFFVGIPDGQTITAANNTTEFNYVFGWTDVSNPGFYLVNATDATLAAGKAYLHTTEALGGGTSARLALIFEDAEATGIADIRSNISNARSEIFDLQGRHIAQPTKGLYIKNGKKIIVK